MANGRRQIKKCGNTNKARKYTSEHGKSSQKNIPNSINLLYTTSCARVNIISDQSTSEYDYQPREPIQKNI